MGEKLNTVKNLLMKDGFKYEGFRRDVYVRNGVAEGLHILGITKKDWSDMK